MVPSRDSMLEAFKDAKGNKGSVGGPFGGAAGGGGSERSARERGRGVVIFLAAVGVAFVLGVLVGRSTAPPGEVQAARGSGDAGEVGDEASFALDPASPWIDAADEVPPSAPAERASPLFDPRNKYTIVAISYATSKEALAFANYDHLVAAGLQAFPPFRTPNGVIVLVVGAAPKESALADALTRLQRLSGPDGQGRPYATAYTHPIRKLIDSGAGD